MGLRLWAFCELVDMMKLFPLELLFTKVNRFFGWVKKRSFNYSFDWPKKTNWMNAVGLYVGYLLDLWKEPFLQKIIKHFFTLSGKVGTKRTWKYRLSLHLTLKETIIRKIIQAALIIYGFNCVLSLLVCSYPPWFGKDTVLSPISQECNLFK